MSDPQLEQGFGFDAATLALNRAGQLTTAQAAKVAATAKLAARSGRLAVSVFGLIALAFSGFLLLADSPEMRPVRPILLAMAGGLGLLTLGIWIQTRRHVSGLTAARISTREGPVRLKRKRVRNLGTAFIVTLAGRTFQLEGIEEFAALEDGTSYRFYVVENGRVPIILSVERL